MNKNIARLRRAKSTRAHIRELGVPRLSVLRTGQHLYAQVFTADGSKVLAAASTTQSDVGGEELGVQVLAGAQHRQARHAEFADVRTGRLGAAQAGDVLVHCQVLES